MFGDGILSLRPTNAMHQLGGASRVPLFNLTHVLGGLAGESLLWIPSLPHPACLPGLFRAAAHVGCPMGLALAPSKADPDELKAARPAALFHQAVSTAASIGRPVPFCLHVQAPAVDGRDGMAFDAVRSFLGECLQLGYTSFGLDLSACEPGDLAEMCRGLLAPALELELGTCLRLKARGAGEQERVESLQEQVRALLEADLRPSLLIVDGPQAAGDTDWSAWRELQALLPPDCGLAKSSLAGLSRSGRIALRDSPFICLLADDSLERRFPEARAVAEPERLEALSYVEASALFEELGGRRVLNAWARRVTSS